MGMNMPASGNVCRNRSCTTPIAKMTGCVHLTLVASSTPVHEKRNAPSRLPNHREGLLDDGTVDVLPVGEPFPKFDRFRRQFIVPHFLDRRLQSVNPLDPSVQGREVPVVVGLPRLQIRRRYEFVHEVHGQRRSGSSASSAAAQCRCAVRGARRQERRARRRDGGGAVAGGGLKERRRRERSGVVEAQGRGVEGREGRGPAGESCLERHLNSPRVGPCVRGGAALYFFNAEVANKSQAR
mmetsp:Transcript_25517/g.75182  ORF Transcript_25517/g.75182 Transcript_25517/m.75182 type:complete len:239 (+) Transcript_25517:1782-2498(+)